LQHMNSLLRVLHGHALGDFEPKRTRRHKGSAEYVADLLNELLTEELTGRQIDANEYRLVAARQLLLPFCSLLRRVSKNVRPELDDKVAVLGNLHEIRCTEPAELRMIPAYLRLESCQLLRRQVNDRLVDEANLVALERAPEVIFQDGVIPGFLPHFRQKHLDPIRTAALGAVHGDFRFFQQILRIVLAPGHDRDAGRRRERDLLAGNLDRRTQSAPYALGDHRELARLVLGYQQNCELIATDPRQRVLRADMAHQAPRHREQQTVSDDQAERGVDVLE